MAKHEFGFTKREAVTFVLLHSFGNFLLLMSLYGVVMTFGQALSHELRYRLIAARGVEFAVAEAPQEQPQKTTQETGGFAEILAGDKEKILVPKDPGFSISIAKIGASAKIFPNVDPGRSEEFLPVLQQGVAHAKGSLFPGMNGTTYLFAHSADNWWNVGRYNAIFYLLHHLEKGDEIVIFFENKRYTYIVSQTLVADADDTTLLKKVQGQGERLVLQTCWPPGTTWKRFYIIATLK